MNVARSRLRRPTLVPVTGATRRQVVQRGVAALLAIGAVGALVVAVDPRSVGSAVRHFDMWLLLPILLLAVAFYAVQGLRWHLLLRTVGARQSLGDSELMNLAGQTVTAVLPLGDLTRALFASRASRVSFGAAAATVTVQELTFTLLLVLLATPGLVHLPGGLVWTFTVVGGVAAVIAILTVPTAFALVRSAVVRTPGLRRLTTQVDALQREVLHLLRTPEVLAGSVLDLVRVAIAATAFWLVIGGLPGSWVSWWGATLALAVSYVGGAVSLLPGGIGANEAGVVGVLMLLGVSAPGAAAAAILQRVSLSGFATVGGLGAYAVLRRRRRVGGLRGLRAAIASAEMQPRVAVTGTVEGGVDVVGRQVEPRGARSSASG